MTVLGGALLRVLVGPVCHGLDPASMLPIQSGLDVGSSAPMHEQVLVGRLPALGATRRLRHSYLQGLTPGNTGSTFYITNLEARQVLACTPNFVSTTALGRRMRSAI